MKLNETYMNKGRLIASDLVIDFGAGTVEQNGQTLVLPDLTWRTLCCLASRDGAVVTIDQLIQAVWGDKDVTNETVTQRIKLLRRELGDDGQNPRYIGTVRNRGFRFLPSAAPPKPLPSRSFLMMKVALSLFAIIAVFWTYNQFRVADVPQQAETDLARIIGRGKEYLSRLQREDNQLAISLFEEALKRDGDNQDALVGLSFAVSHNATKFNYPLTWARRGEMLARKAVGIGASSRAYHALAFALDAQGQTDEAINYYEMGRSLEPENAAVLNSVAYLYQVRGQLAQALEYGMAAYALNPDITFSEVQVAATLHLLERDSEASEWIARGLILKPDNVFIYSAKANFLFALGRDKAVLETIDEATANGIERPELYIMQGVVAVNEGRLDEARKSFLAANRLSPSRQSGGAYLIWLDMMSGQDAAHENARLWVNSSKDVSNPTALFVAAGLHTGLGDFDMAIKTLQKAIDAGYRDWRTLNRHPMFAELRDTPQFTAAIGRMRDLVSVERLKVE